MGNAQEFGSVWTATKLDVVEKYLAAYTNIMKNQHFKTCYIDAFAGSGSVVIKSGEALDGSTIRALKYPFDKYYFFELDYDNYNRLKQRVDCSEKKDIILLHNRDCNEALMNINKKRWKREGWRGVVFIDPFSMSMPWSCLEEISKTEAFDIWYLFPFYAVNRNLFRNRNIPAGTKETLTKILGASDWESEIYKESPQLSFFDEKNYEKVGTQEVKEYIIKRLKETFSTVSDKAAILRNEKHAPLFLLCFAGSNPSPAAKKVSLSVANYLLTHIEETN